MKPDASTAIWDTIMYPQLQSTKWCDSFKDWSSMIYLTRPLVLYQPVSVIQHLNNTMDTTTTKVNISNQTPVPGYVAKPAVVDLWSSTGRRGIYILRSVVVYGKAYAVNPAG